MIDKDLENHLHGAALRLPERAPFSELLKCLENLGAKIGDSTKDELLERFDLHKKWQSDSRVKQQVPASPLTPPRSSRTDISPPRLSISRGPSPTISQNAERLLINPVHMKDSVNPKICRDQVIPVEEYDDGGNINYIAYNMCRIFGLGSAKIGQEVVINYTRKGETDLLQKKCIVRPWGKVEGGITANVIFAKDRPKHLQPSDAPTFPDNLPVPKSFLEPTFISADEQKLYHATFHTEEFLAYFSQRLIRFHTEAEAFPQGLESRRIHEFKFSCWVDWSTRQVAYPPGG